ncbi:capsid protein [[Actinobacillus] muris]|uniref:Capsid protein n=1 Tax=Muribacter muris TaxID=67855 RepID=A0A0J5P499_9PAST|nr:P2 family phage major capsid protein [Muribacter muris]KMK50520.1 capsid protein [[Actinobacillus] muris] [Muribacter muris]
MSISHFAHALKLDQKGNTVYFDDNPAEQKKLLKRLKRNRLFKHLNLVTTRFEQGDAIGLFTPIAGTTDTLAGEERSPKLALAPYQRYHCEQVNLDSYIPYSRIDHYNLENELETHLNAQLDRSLLNGLLMVGWLEKIRKGKPQAVINGSTVGENGQFKSLNALIKQALTYIAPAYAAGGEMIAICGREIIGDSPIAFQQADLDEELAELLTLSQRTIGGLKAVSIPYFPSNVVLITRLDNLSLYVHLNNIRRKVIDQPKCDAVQTFYSLNIDYVVEDFNACCLVENIEIND